MNSQLVWAEAKAQLYLLEALTLYGQASDGHGILSRLEAEIRKRAEEEWRATQNPNDEENWINAERKMVLALPRSSIPGQALVEDTDSKRANPRVECELQELRVQLAERTACTKRLEEENRELITKLSLQDAELERMRQELAFKERAASRDANAKVQDCPHAQDKDRSCAGKASMRLVWLQQELASTDRLLGKRTQLLTQTEDALTKAREDFSKKNAAFKALETEVVKLREVNAAQEEELNVLRDDGPCSFGVGSGSWQSGSSAKQDLSEKVEYLQQELVLTEQLLAERNTLIRELEIAKAKATQKAEMAKMTNEVFVNFARITDNRHAKESSELSTCRQASAEGVTTRDKSLLIAGAIVS